jgi:hypothetical protein
MTTEHDEALVERVAQAIADTDGRVKGWTPCPLENWAPQSAADFRAKARAAIYPPAPPKTRLQVARELLANTCHPSDTLRDGYIKGDFDGGTNIKAVLAALALPAMED